MISQWRKDEMRTKLKALKKTVDDNDKANKAKLVEKVHIMVSYVSDIFTFNITLQAVEKSKEIIEVNRSSSAIIEVLLVQGLTKVIIILLLLVMAL